MNKNSIYGFMALVIVITAAMELIGMFRLSGFVHGAMFATCTLIMVDMHRTRSDKGRG